MRAVRVGNAEVEHLALIDDDEAVDVALHSLCNVDGWFPIIEAAGVSVMIMRQRLDLCPECGQLLHDLTLLADPPTP